MAPRFRGLTWDHPRGFTALNAAAPEGLLCWDKQPLEGFESAPIADLCADYDLVVMDHPHLGEALAAGCLWPLDEVFASNDLARISAASIGPSYDSFLMGGRQWALPLDAATQVMAARPDLMDRPPPATWASIEELSARSGKVALSLAGPHAILSLLSIITAIEPEMDLRDGGLWPDDRAAGEAYDLLSALAARSPKVTYALNPIGILEHMSCNDDVALCPLIYGYVNYSNPKRPQSIAFYNAPAMIKNGPPGTILGGTGIAISRRCRVDETLRDHLIWLLSAEVQRVFIPQHDGQPSARDSWLDSKVNAQAGDFYRNTTTSLEQAAIRPRHNGYIAFQRDASALLRDAFTTKAGRAKTIGALRDMFHNNTDEGGMS